MDGNIYICTNLINGKQNVGQTMREVKERIKQHKNGSNPTSILHKAIKKYGLENFKWISYSCSEEDLDWHERFLIKELGTLAPNGYNLDSGGNKQKHRHKITKQKISETRIENGLSKGRNNPMFNIHRFGKDSPHFGHKYTEEWKQQHSERMRGILSGEKNPRVRPVILTSPEGIEYKLSYYKDFCKEHSLVHSGICQVLRGNRKHHKGWIGRYI
jgi:group I intron endonuclease